MKKAGLFPVPVDSGENSQSTRLSMNEKGVQKD